MYCKKKKQLSFIHVLQARALNKEVNVQIVKNIKWNWNINVKVQVKTNKVFGPLDRVPDSAKAVSARICYGYTFFKFFFSFNYCSVTCIG